MLLGESVIASTGLNGSGVNLPHHDHITLFGPGALTGVLTVQIMNYAGSWVDLVDLADAPVTLPVAVAKPVGFVNGIQVRVQSTLAEGAERTVEIHGSGPTQA